MWSTPGPALCVGPLGGFALGGAACAGSNGCASSPRRFYAGTLKSCGSSMRSASCKEPRVSSEKFAAWIVVFYLIPPPGVHPWPIANSMRMSLNLAVVQVHMSLDSAQQTRKCHSCVVTFNLGHPVSFSLSPDGDPMVLPWRSDPSPSPTPKAPSPNRQPAQKQIPLQPPRVPGTPPDSLAHWLPPGGGPSPSGMRGRDRR